MRDRLALSVVVGVVFAGVAPGVAQTASSPAMSMPAFRSNDELSEYLQAILPAPPSCAGARVLGSVTPGADAYVDSASSGAAIIRGRVTVPSPEGRGLNGSSVYIDSLAIGTTTDSTGRYELRIPRSKARPGDTVLVRARLIGFYEQRRKIAVTFGVSIRLDFALCYRAIRGSPVLYQGDADPDGSSAEPGVDVPDVVKRYRDLLVILRRGRLFTVRVGGGSLVPVSSIKVSIADGRQQQCHELLLAGNRVLVISLWSNSGSNTVESIRLDRSGHLYAEGIYESYSEPGTAVVADGKLVLHTELQLNSESDRSASLLPVLRRQGGEGGAAKVGPFATVRDIYRPTGQAPPVGGITMHTVAVCDPSVNPWRCRATLVLGDPSRGIHVTGTAAYLWTSRSSGGGEPLVPGLDSATAMLLRVPLDGSAPQALRVAGNPWYVGSFRESPEGTLNVFVRGDSVGHMMWYPDTVAGNNALLRLPPRSFGAGNQTAPAASYRWLPSVETGNIQIRFLGDHLLYAVTEPAEKRSGRTATLYDVPISGGRIRRLDLPHAVDIIVSLGRRAIVGGLSRGEFQVSIVSRDTATHAAASFLMDSAALAGIRVAAVFGDSLVPNGATVGLALRGLGPRESDPNYAMPIGVLLVGGDERQLDTLVRLQVTPPPAVADPFGPWCADRLGVARPLYMPGRILALVGPWLIEGTMHDGRVIERRRVQFDERASARPVEK